jgi:uncharacterized protein DUF4352
MGKTKVLPAVVLMTLLLGCNIGGPEARVNQMGELTTVGPVLYNVLETEWRTDLGSTGDAAIPENKFLLVRLSITNSGNHQIAVPLLSVDDPEGESHMELDEVKGVPDWLGLLRILEPASSIQGTIVFDVPSGDYQLRVTDCGDLESERTALINMPLTITTPGRIDPSDPGTL